MQDTKLIKQHIKAYNDVLFLLSMSDHAYTIQTCHISYLILY